MSKYSWGLSEEDGRLHELSSGPAGRLMRHASIRPRLLPLLHMIRHTASATSVNRSSRCHGAECQVWSMTGPPKPLAAVVLGDFPSKRMSCQPDHVTSSKSMSLRLVEAMVWKRQLGEAKTSA